MDLSATSNLCPFCEKGFVRLGNHFKHCPRRQGRDYEQLLSQKTLQKKQKKQKKGPCPKCGKLFERLDTHLRSNAVCQTIPQPPQPSQPQASPVSQTQEDATCQSTVGPLPPCTTSVPLHNPVTVNLFPQLTCQKKQVSGKK